MKPRKPIRRSGIKRKPVRKKRAKSELSAFKKKLWIKFAAWIKRGNSTCFSCGKRDLVGKQLHAGHMFSAGKYPAIRWDKMNVWPQCAYCNIFLRGNYIEYHARFKEQFGEAEYNRLYLMRNDVKQWRLEDLKEIERMIDAKEILQKA